ncbi:MAG: hypothetical protein ABI790_04720, partial [Betaproteobacteria bacterium]
MRSSNRLLSGLGVILLAAVLLPLDAMEMSSRAVLGTASAPATLRSSEAPVMEVRIAPTRKQLVDAAQGIPSRDGDAGMPAGTLPPPGPSTPRRVGTVFPSNADGQIVQWQTLPDGGLLTHVRITSVGARGIRARLQLPAGMTQGELRVATSSDDDAEILPLFLAQQGEIWTPYTDGDTQIVEIHTRPRVDRRGGSLVRVADIVHFEESLNTLGGPRLPSRAAAAGACNPDVVCTTNNSSVDAAIAERSRSVARISFQSGNGSFLCSGTLVNSPIQQNFLLTANHCISTQAEASSISTRWFYESSACGGAAMVSPAMINVGGGAQLVFTNQFVDSTLLRMNLPPPAGAIFSGWSSVALTANSSVVSISHPAGDVMKYALGTLSSTIQNRSDGLIRLAEYEQEMYAVLFNRGVIEGGSSGSGLFVFANGSLQLRGVLSSSTTRYDANGISCGNPRENVNYGRFDYFYPQIAPLLNGRGFPLEDFPNQPSPSAPATPIGATVDAALSYAGDIDVFRIPVTQAGTLFARSAGGYDLIGNLMDASGSTLKTNDDSFAGNNEFGITWRVNPGTYYLAVAPWDPALVTSSGYRITTRFTTATTNYTSLWWGGDAQSGWGINVNHQGNTIFVTMFTYEAAGQGTQNPGMWLASTGTRIAGINSFAGDLLRVRGPAFNAAPFTPITAASSTRVGSLRIDFSGANTGTLTYDVAGDGTGGTGAVITRSITRQAFGTLPLCEFSGSDRSFAVNYQDLWWNPAESGWGINFTHQGDTVFATLFTYEPGAGTFNKDIWLTATMPRIDGDEIFQGDLLRVTGSAFNADPFVPLNPAANTTRVGNMRVVFSDGNSA